MTFTQITEAVQAQKQAGFRYQQAGRRAFRDRFTVYRDGKILFERFCYGESAGLVFTMWAHETQADGTICWDYDACLNSAKNQVPKQLTGGTLEALELDGKTVLWEQVALLKTDAANGYGGLGGIFGKLFRK